MDLAIESAKSTAELYALVQGLHTKLLALDACDSACQSLESMKRATDRLCGLARDDDEQRRCEDARRRYEESRTRVREACPGCDSAQ